MVGGGVMGGQSSTPFPQIIRGEVVPSESGKNSYIFTVRMIHSDHPRTVRNTFVFQKGGSKIFVYKLWNNLNFKERRY